MKQFFFSFQSALYVGLPLDMNYLANWGLKCELETQDYVLGFKGVLGTKTS